MPRPEYPPRREGYDRVTSSSLRSFLMCGLRFEFDKERRFSTVPMLIGSSVAEAAKADNVSKLEHGEPIGVIEIMDRAVAAYEEEVSDTSTEVVGAAVSILAGKDAAVDAAHVYGTKVSPVLTGVTLTEQAIVADIGDAVELAGTPDYFTDSGIGDLKVGRMWRAEDVDRSRQLTIYGILHKAQMGEYPSRVWIDSIYRIGDSGWKWNRFYSGRTEADYDAARETIERTMEAMRVGVRLPAAEGSWWCSPKWCAHWNRCPAVIGRKG